MTRRPDPTRKMLKLLCSKCGKFETIRVNNPDIYTDEIKKKYTCIKCTPLKRQQGEATNVPKDRTESDSSKVAENSQKDLRVCEGVRTDSTTEESKSSETPTKD